MTRKTTTTKKDEVSKFVSAMAKLDNYIKKHPEWDKHAIGKKLRDKNGDE